jgi:aspartate aminotransferase-like enzyme
MVEGAILYSSFAFLKHFQAKGKNKLRNVVRGINFSVRDENLHAEGGAWLYRTLKQEMDDCDRLNTIEMNQSDREYLIEKAARELYEHECRIIDMIFEEGLEAVWSRHEVLAKAIWAAVEAWGADGPMVLNVANHVDRSCAVTAAQLGAPAAKDLRLWLEDKVGVTLGIGLGMSTDEDPDGEGFFRFGHMGHVNAHMVLGMLATVEAGMIALDIPHGAGALTAAAQVVAEGA